MLRDQIDQIRQRVSLQEYVKSKGIALKKSGDYGMGKCPFHADSSASFAVWDDHFHCYGCGAHGDVIDFLSRKGLEFGEALKEAASVAGLKLEYSNNGTEPRRGDEELTKWVLECHKNLLANEEALKYLNSRGLKLEAVKRIKAGLCEKSPTAYGKDLKGRLIFPVMRSGRPINATCRAYAEHNEAPKYKTLGTFEVFPFASHNLKTKTGKCVLVEGVIDAEIIIALGMASCATLMLHFKQEWLVFLDRSVEYILCYDNDDNESGQKGTRRIGEILYDAGYRVSVASLPPGKDPGDLIGTADGIATLKHTLQNPHTWPEYLIRTMPTGLGAYDTERLLEGSIFPALAKAPAVALDALLDLLAKIGGHKRVSLKAAWDAWRKKIAPTEQRNENSQSDFSPVFGDENPLYFNPAQWFGDDLACYTVYAESPDGSLVPFVITSDKQVFPLSDDSISRLGLKMRNNKWPSESITWPVGKRYDFSVPNYLEGRGECDPVKLFRSIEEILERHIWFPEEWEEARLLLVLWSIGTYVHQLFDSYPYLHAMALPESGKSTLLRVLGSVAFNAAKSDSLTESVVSRSVNADSATLLIDEAQTFRQKSGDETSSIFEVLKGGYKQGGASYKAGDRKANFRPERYDTYSAKMFASTDPIDSILATRCIEIPLERCTGVKLPAFMPEEKADHFSLLGIKGHCYAFGLQYFQQIRQIYLELEPEGEWKNRSWEIWKPVIAMARFFDAIFDVIGESLEAEKRVEALAVKTIRRKRERENDMNFHQRIMSVILDYVRENYNELEVYPTWILVKRIQDDLNMPRFSPERLSRFIFDEAGIAISRHDDKCKVMSIHDAGKRIWHYRLRRELVWKRAVSLFNFPVSILDELQTTPDPFAD